MKRTLNVFFAFCVCVWVSMSAITAQAAEVDLLYGGTFSLYDVAGNLAGTSTKISDGSNTTSELIYRENYTSVPTYVIKAKYVFSEPVKVSSYQATYDYNLARLTFTMGDGSSTSVITEASAVRTTLPTPLLNVVSLTVTSVPSSNTTYLYDLKLFGEGMPPPPPPPADITISKSTVTANSVTLNISGGTGADSKKVFRDSELIATLDGTASSYTDSGRSGSTTYSYYVTAVNAGGTKASNVLSITTLETPPTPPPGDITISKGSVSYESVTLVISGGLGADSKSVYRDGEKVATLAGSASSYKDSGRTEKTTYSYYVTAVNAGGTRASNILSVTTPEKPPPVPPPEVSSLSIYTTKTEIKATWYGGVAPFTVTWGGGSKTTTDRSILLGGFSPGQVVTVTVTDANGSSKSATVKIPATGDVASPDMPDGSEPVQGMVDIFVTAGKYALVVIGAAVALGIIVILGIYTWRLLKRWLSSAK